MLEKRRSKKKERELRVMKRAKRRKRDAYAFFFLLPQKYLMTALTKAGGRKHIIRKWCTSLSDRMYEEYALPFHGYENLFRSTFVRESARIVVGQGQALGGIFNPRRL